MLRPLRTIRDHFSAYSDRSIAATLPLFIVLIVVSVTGIATIHQMLLPALTGSAGFKTLLVAITLFLFPVQGLVLPYFMARRRPHLRVLSLSVLFLAAFGSYLVFLFDWWVLLGEYIGLLDLMASGESSFVPEIGDVLRHVFLPHVFIVLLKDILLAAFLQCVIWEILRQRQAQNSSIQPEAVPTAQAAALCEEGTC